MLTHTDLLSLPASRELDALVAERVMGVVVYANHDWATPMEGSGGLDRFRCHACGKIWAATDARPECGGMSAAPYSTSITAAWEVLEHLKPTLNFVLFYYGEQHPVRTTTNPDAQRPAFCCEIHPGLYVGRADTAPLAICRAALQTVGASDA